MKTAFLNVITTSTPGFSALFAAVFFFYLSNMARVKSFFSLDDCLWLFISLISLKYAFVSYDCCSGLKAVWIKAKNFFLFGWNVVTNAKLLLSVIAFEALKFSMGILVTFWIASWIKFCPILGNIKLFQVRPSVFF